MVDPSTYTHVFSSVPLSADEAFDDLVLVVDKAMVRLMANWTSILRSDVARTASLRVSTLRVVPIVLCGVVGALSVDCARSAEPSTMTVQAFEDLARSRVPIGEPESGISYDYAVVEGTVEDLRFEAPPEGARDFGVRAYCVALIDVHAMEGVPAISGQWSVLELTLVHPHFYNADGLAGHRAPADGRALFDRLQVGDYIVAVGVKTNDPTLRRVSFSDDDRFANVFSVVRRGNSDESPVAIVGGERSLVTDWRRRGEPWTLVDPSLIEREFVHVELSIREVFVRLVNVVKERRKP